MGTVQLRWTEKRFERRFLVNVSEISEWVSLFSKPAVVKFRFHRRRSLMCFDHRFPNVPLLAGNQTSTDPTSFKQFC